MDEELRARLTHVLEPVCANSNMPHSSQSISNQTPVSQAHQYTGNLFPCRARFVCLQQDHTYLRRYHMTFHPSLRGWGGGLCRRANVSICSDVCQLPGAARVQ